MSYIGVRVKHKTIKAEYLITIKLHGPLDTFVTDPAFLKKYVLERMRTYNSTFDMVDTANKLADDLVEHYCDGNMLVWAEVEINSNNETIYSASAAKVDEECQV